MSSAHARRLRRDEQREQRELGEIHDPSVGSTSRSIQNVSLIQYTRHLPRAPPALDARPRASVSEENSSERPRAYSADSSPEHAHAFYTLHITMCSSVLPMSVTDRPAYATLPPSRKDIACDPYHPTPPQMSRQASHAAGAHAARSRTYPLLVRERLAPGPARLWAGPRIRPETRHAPDNGMFNQELGWWGCSWVLDEEKRFSARRAAVGDSVEKGTQRA